MSILSPSIPALPDVTGASISSTVLWRLIALIVGLTGLFVLRGWLLSLSLSALCEILSVYSAGALFMTIRMTGAWSPSSIYLLVFGVFHFGLTLVVGIGLLSPEVEALVSLWFYRQETKEAIFLASLGAVSCSIGIHLAHLLGSRFSPTRVPETDGNHRYARALSLVGGILVIISVGAWFFAVVASGGPSLLVSSYVEYLDATESSSSVIAFIWFGMGLGLSFLAASEPSRWRLISFSAFVCFALVALPLGLRGEVLFPSFAGAVIMAKRTKPPSTKLAIAGGLMLLFVIPLLKDVRQEGIANASGVSGNPLDGLTELGQSLRPTAEVVYWHELGDRFQGGATYWAPFQRPFCRVQPSLSCIPADRDERLTGTLVLNRVGPIGFSPIAEAFLNFGQAGVVLIMCLIGLLLGRMDLWQPTRLRCAALGVILVELLINVRNSFAATPSHIIMGIVLLFTVAFLARAIEPRTVSLHA